MIDLTDGDDGALFLLRVEMTGSRLRGSLTRLDEVTTVSFDGWIDFMTLLEELRRQDQHGELK